MRPFTIPLPGALSLCVLLGTAAAAPPVLADSLITSSAAGGSSASSAASSASQSSKGSSNSSSKEKTVVEGPYQIIEVVALAEQPGMVRLRLQARADPGPDGELLLVLPQPTFERSRLAPGETVTARARPYGLEFAHAGTDRAFFLVLSDDWYRELASNPVVL